jgi:hypothetical protein
MHKGIMGLANGGDPDESKLRKWQGRRRAGTGGARPGVLTSRFSTARLLEEAKRNALIHDSVKSLVRRVAQDHEIHNVDVDYEDIFNREVRGFPSAKEGQTNKTVAELLGITSDDITNTKGSLGTLLPEDINIAYADAREIEANRLAQSRQTTKTKRARQQGRGSESGSKFLVDESDARSGGRSTKGPVNRTAAGPGMPGTDKGPVNRTAAGPGMPRKETPKVYILSDGTKTAPMTRARANELDQLTDNPRGARLRKFQKKFVSPAFDPLTGEFDAAKLSEINKKTTVSFDPYTGTYTETPGKMVAADPKNWTPEQVLKQTIEKPLEGANDATLKVVAEGLEDQFVGTIEQEAKKVATSGGRVTAGHAAPEYIFNRRTVPITEVPVGQKIKDWLDYLRNNAGRGKITPNVVGKAVGKLINTKAMMAAGAALLGKMGGPLVDQVLAVEELGDAGLPEPPMTQAERNAMTSYYEDLMAPDLGVMSPDLDFEEFFGDKPEPGTPMLDVLGIR